MSRKTSFEESLRIAGEKMAAESVPPTLRERVRNAVLAAPLSPKRRANWAPRLAAAGIAALAIAAAAVYAPRSPLVTAGHAASLQEALANARTWHFVGWRIKDGAKVRWEVWGRRQPFLYREQIGDELLIDDGKTRVHILPGGKDRTGSVLILPSAPLSPRASGVRDEQTGAFFLAGVNGDTNVMCGSRRGDSYACSGRVEYLGYPEEIHEETSLNVDGKTNLPIHYAVSRKIYRAKGRRGDKPAVLGRSDIVREYTHAELKPEYDLPVSDSIAEYTIPAGYSVTDATRSPGGVTGRNGAVVTKQGLTLRATVLQQDGEGNVKLRFDGWLGAEPVRYDRQKLGMKIRVIPEMTTQVLPSGDVNQSAAVFDDRGNKYIDFGHPPWTAMNREHPEVWLAPTEPFNTRVNGPRTLKVYAHVSLARYERMVNSGRDVSVTDQIYTFDVPVPAAKTRLVWDDAPDSYGMEYVGIRPTMRMEIAESRAQHYFMAAHALREVTRNQRRMEGNLKQIPADPKNDPVRAGIRQSLEKLAAQRAWYRQDSTKRARFWYGVIQSEAERIPYPMMRDLVKRNMASLDRFEKNYGGKDVP